MEPRSAGRYLALKIHAQTSVSLVGIGRSIIDMGVSNTIVARIDAQSKWILGFLVSALHKVISRIVPSLTRLTEPPVESLKVQPAEPFRQSRGRIGELEGKL